MSTSFDVKKDVASHKPIRIHNIFVFALRNLFYRKLRNGLTIAGVVIGVGSVVSLLSLGLGLRNLVTSQVVGSKSVKTVDVSSIKSDVLPIDQRSYDQIKEISHVAQIAHTYSAPGTISYNESDTSVAVFAANQNYLEASSLKLQAGNALQFNNEDDVIVNTSVVKALGLTDNKDAVGKNIKIVTEIKKTNGETASLEKDFIIKSVVETGSGSELFMSDNLFKRFEPASYAQLKVITDDRDTVADVRSQIEGLGFTTTSPLDTLAQIDQVFRLFTIILAGFGGIGMVIAVLGMINTLTISLLERTKEIGLLITMGARPYDINRLFVIEAVLLSLIGGILGVLGSGIIGFTINQYYVRLATARGVEIQTGFFSMPFYLIVGALISMVVVGIAVVLYPARRASRIKSVEVLRRD